MSAHLAAARRAPMRAEHWLNPARLRNWSFVALMCYLIVGLGYLYHLASHHAGFRQPATDMLPFWSASFLALKGHAIDAYNMQAIKAIELAISPAPVEAGGYVLPWLYPPTALLAVLPLALLPYPAAVVLFVLGSCAFFAVTVRAIVRHAEAGWMALAFPGAALVVVMGQNALLTAALAGLGLHWLRRHPVASGICFGLLFVKPHLAPLFPFALLCSRSWRALASTCLTVAATLVLALFAFGANTFEAFVHATTFATGYVEAGKGCLERIPTFFALMRMLQAPVPLAYALQGISILAACWAVLETWRREAPLALRAATLMCASLLVSPYLHDYDLAWYGVVIAWCCRYGFSHGWRRGEREWLCLLWLAPVLGMLVVARVHVQFLPIISALTLWMLVQRTREAQHAPVVLAGNRDD